MAPPAVTSAFAILSLDAALGTRALPECRELATRHLDPVKNPHNYAVLHTARALLSKPTGGSALQLSWQPKSLRAVILLTTAGLCAFFLAQAVSNLLALSLLPYHPQTPAGKGTALATLKGDNPPDAMAILRRNIFDPQTGPLPKPEAPPPTAAEGATTPDEEAVVDEAHLPQACDGGVRLVASMYSTRSPEWSFVSLALSAGSPLLYRNGDTVENRTVHTIFPEAVLLKNSNGSLCSLTMFQPSTPAAPPPPPPPPAAEASVSTPGGDPELDQGIKQLSDTRYSVRRSLLDKLLQNQGELMRAARVVPHEENGRVVGVKLYGIRKTSLFGKLGLQNGDMLRTINGFDMGSPDSALEAYTKLRSATSLSVALVRRGNAMTMDYTIGN